MQHPERLLAIAALLVGALTTLLVQRSWRRWRGRLVARRRAARYLRGERDAERLLERRGYRVLERQATRAWTIQTGGQPHDVDLRADLLVEQDGLRYVAEVKTGIDAPRLANAATRRQLLEYRVAYDVDGILLVDVEAGQVVDVEFPRVDFAPADAASTRASWIAIAGAALVGAVAGAAVVAYSP